MGSACCDGELSRGSCPSNLADDVPLAGAQTRRQEGLCRGGGGKKSPGGISSVQGETEGGSKVRHRESIVKWHTHDHAARLAASIARRAAKQRLRRGWSCDLSTS